MLERLAAPLDGGRQVLSLPVEELAPLARQRFSFFAAFARPSPSAAPSRLVIAVGRFAPDLKNLHRVDGCWHVGPGRVYRGYTHKIARWHAEVAGLLESETTLRVAGNLFSFLVFPFETVYQLILYKLGRAGLAFVHALGAEKEGMARVLIGRSGIGKSTLGGWFLRDGHRLLGAAAGIVAIALLAVTCAFDRRRWVIGLAAGALLLVVFQGLLGGARVLMDERSAADRSFSCSADAGPPQKKNTSFGRFAANSARVASEATASSSRTARSPLVTGGSGCRLNSNSVTTPKLPPPPRSAQSSSGSPSAPATTKDPSAVNPAWTMYSSKMLPGTSKAVRVSLARSIRQRKGSVRSMAPQTRTDFESGLGTGPLA